jgi:hypothetical protein
MARILRPLILIALLLAFGCGKGATVVPPKDVPPQPQGKPLGGGAGTSSGDMPPPVKP